MDWRKIKTYLIAGLLIANLILAANLYFSSVIFNSSTQKEDKNLNVVGEILSKKSIALAIHTLVYQTSINDVEVAYKVFDQKSIADKILGDYRKTGSGIYESSNGTISFEDSGTLLKYSLKKPKIETGGSDEADAKRVADEFLKKSGLDYDEAVFRGVKKEQGYLSVLYEGSYDGLFFENSFIEARISGGSVVGLKAKWISITAKSATKRDIIPPSKALLKFYNRIPEGESGERRVITEVSLGYRLGADMANSTIKSGDAMPYWRIYTSDGKVSYIEAIN